MDIICINNKFTKLQLELFQRFDIVIPELDCLYNVRELIRTFNGASLLLEQIVNPIIPMTSTMNHEPTWAISRFRDLQGNPLVISEILESLKASTLNIGLELVSINDDENNNEI